MRSAKFLANYAPSNNMTDKTEVSWNHQPDNLGCPPTMIKIGFEVQKLQLWKRVDELSHDSHEVIKESFASLCLSPKDTKSVSGCLGNSRKPQTIPFNDSISTCPCPRAKRTTCNAHVLPSVRVMNHHQAASAITKLTIDSPSWATVNFPSTVTNHHQASN